MPARETLLSQTFVQLADTLVDEFDIIDLLTVLADRCVEILDAGAAGILLADHHGVLHVVAASSEQARLLELFQLQNQEGPCLDCYTSGAPVVNEDLTTTKQWPRFASEAREAGFRSVQALPLRLREHTIGALNVFLDDRFEVSDADLTIAQALADAATIAILHDQAAREAQLVTGQLQTALNSRIVIEQAKGVLAERARVDMDEAFSRLRRHARDHNRPLSSVATDLVQGQLSDDVVAGLLRTDQRR
jgi:transcriptional regulator with GAF, ATPase, and Fis domain